MSDLPTSATNSAAELPLANELPEPFTSSDQPIANQITETSEPMAVAETAETSEPSSEEEKSDEPSSPSAHEQRHQRARVLLHKLCETYPQAFFPLYQRVIKPLKINIHLELLEQISEWGYSKADLRLAMVKYTRTRRYQQSLIHEAQRIDLKGELAGEVTEEQRQIARDNLPKFPLRRSNKPEQTTDESEIHSEVTAESQSSDALVSEKPKINRQRKRHFVPKTSEPRESSVTSPSEDLRPASLPHTDAAPNDSSTKPIKLGRPSWRKPQSKATHDSDGAPKLQKSSEKSVHTVPSTDKPRRQLDPKLIAELQAKMSRKASVGSTDDVASAINPSSDSDETS